MTPLAVVLVAAGGAVGTLLRWGVSLAFNPQKTSEFPWGTFAVNLLGCLAIGVLAGAFGGFWESKPHWRSAVFIGILGGFTTFSSFAFEAISMARSGGVATALAYVAASIVGGLSLAAGGLWATRTLS